jgi:alkaline phosphatase D
MRRRDILSGGAGLALLGRAPALIASDRLRPQLPYGVMSGDVDGDRAMLWAASDRPARMIVEWAVDPTFRRAHRRAGGLATLESGLTAHCDLAGLPPGREIHYRIAFQNTDDSRQSSDWAAGQLRTAPAESAASRPLRFTFAGDEAGQGFGINPEFGGYRLYAAMHAKSPNVFIHQGDQIYADGPLKPEIATPGGVWRNLVTPAKDHVAQSLDDFRGAFAYNLLDTHKRAFLAATPVLVQWDDHEVRNNWFPDKQIAGATPMPSLIANARQALLDYNPIRLRAGAAGVSRRIACGPLLDVFLLDARTARGRNDAATQPAAVMFGAEQVTWLKAELARSRAVWKLIASDIPLSLTVPDLNRDVQAGSIEGLANGVDGPPDGRESELASILSFIRDRAIFNTVWISADVHYAAAIRYEPGRARTGDFLAFWEFVAGPINAGTGTMALNPLDPTFGPEVVFKAVPDKLDDPSPFSSNQFFGMGEIDPVTKELTMSIHDLDGAERFRVCLGVQA